MKQLGSVWKDDIAKQPVKLWQLANRSLWQSQLGGRLGPAILRSYCTVSVIDFIKVIIWHPVI